MEQIGVGQKIKELRLLAGFSQEKLAEESGLSLRSIQRIENNQTVPRGDSLSRLSAALNVPLDTLTGYRYLQQTEKSVELKEDPKILLLIMLSAFAYLINPLVGILVPAIVWLLFKDSTSGAHAIGLKIIRLELLFCLALGLAYAYIVSHKLFGVKLPVPANGKSVQTFMLAMYVANGLAIFGILVNWTMMRKSFQKA